MRIRLQNYLQSEINHFIHDTLDSVHHYSSKVSAVDSSFSDLGVAVSEQRALSQTNLSHHRKRESLTFIPSPPSALPRKLRMLTLPPLLRQYRSTITSNLVVLEMIQIARRTARDGTASIGRLAEVLAEVLVGR